MTINEIIKQIENRPKADIELIQRAFEFAQKAHQGQKRKSGKDFIEHPLATASILAEMNLDPPTIAAGLLHDVVDDTEKTDQEIEEKFGSKISFLVKGVSKLGKIKYRGEESQIETLRRMFLALAEDIRVVLIKLADRFHNLQTLNYLSSDKQKRIALETLEIYAPLAHRLGIGEIKGLLEDLAFPYAFSKEY
ncbi:MAG TPA: bifunctional (p)ppGpp synthetase/guanosine-3',5'-bis(diphosphate) 3'-pyrophosphohydrolase, partial [Candidatus Portnoybacteria bacterium]|nr:bifunctional (p)ppGpp synthetase/guanosine-3',5'-bis(diphosphate) 3'-pyrophosphohydrolase [Candidatus Portnoybacteria bacterium]